MRKSFWVIFFFACWFEIVRALLLACVFELVKALGLTLSRQLHLTSPFKTTDTLSSTLNTPFTERWSKESGNVLTGNITLLHKYILAMNLSLKIKLAREKKPTYLSNQYIQQVSEITICIELHYTKSLVLKRNELYQIS